MRYRLPTLCLLLPGLWLVAGCQRLDTSAAWKLEAGDVYNLQVEPARSQQKVTATVTASGPVTACLVLDKDFPAARDALQADRTPANTLDCKEKAADITLTATVPAGERYCLVVGSVRKQTDVQVKMKGR